MSEPSSASEFARGLDSTKYDAWFQDPTGRSWQAANEVMMRRFYANLHPVGDPIDPNTSKTGDPGFDAMLEKVCGTHNGSV